ncbi:MAG: cytochrome c-type biogenesis protein CcmH [Methylovulum sp.]|nr:cytochrome c-type biogenesis protein CcmH [Methylovulum sp.]
MKQLILILTLLLVPVLAQAIDSRQLATPEQQEAYDSLTAELRCLVCQNQTIADSNAELAADLRRQVYEMLEKGQSKEAILQFMTDRYGDFVLYKPPFKAKTGLLWLGPALFLVLGLLAVFWVIKQKKAAQSPEQGQAEKLAKIRRLLDEGDAS